MRVVEFVVVFLGSLVVVGPVSVWIVIVVCSKLVGEWFIIGTKFFWERVFLGPQLVISSVFVVW
jgi:hypothetical protein